MFEKLDLRASIDPLRKTLPFLVFLSTFLFLNHLENHYRSFAPDRIHFHYWTSDMMMQTLPILQLRTTPLESLWYLHIQPPMLDAIRAGIAFFLKQTPIAYVLWDVDKTLYFLWSLFFAGMAVFIFIWLKRLINTLTALLATFVWIFHPAPIFYATYLDSTFLGAFGILWFYYALWKIYKENGSCVNLALASIFIFYTRSVFQWYFFPLLFVALVLMKVSRKDLLIFTAIIILGIVPYLLKQKILFQTFFTTTWSGNYKCGVIWFEPTPEEIREMRETLKFHYPPEADRFSGWDRNNSRKQYEDNLIYTRLFNKQIRSHPLQCLDKLWHSTRRNLQLYIQPSNQYSGSIMVDDWYRRDFYKFLFSNQVAGTGHVINDRLPWRKVYDLVFSNWVWIGLLAFAIFAWFYRGFRRGKIGDRRTVGFLLPFLYIFIITGCLSNQLWWSESQRYKFSLEPVFYIFLISQIVLFLKIQIRNGRKSIN